MQINRWLQFVQKKDRPEKVHFMAETNRTVLSFRLSVKYISAPNFLIFGKSLGEGRKQIASQLQSVIL